MRGRARRWLTVPVAMAVTATGLLVGAGSAQAIGAVHFVTVGTAAPPTTLGPYSMTAFGSDPRPHHTAVSTAPGPTGDVGLSVPMEHLHGGDYLTTGGDLNGGWGNGYTGDVYAADGQNGAATAVSVTLTLPAGTSAFYLYAMARYFGTFRVTATTDNGTSSGPVGVTTSEAGNEANYFGFYTDDNSSISSITVSVQAAGGGITVGEFGISSALTANPVFTSLATTTFAALVPHSFEVTTLVDSAHGVATLSCPGCIVPGGMSFTPGAGGAATFAGTTDSNSGGVYPFTLVATNPHGTTNQAFTLIVDQPAHLTGPYAPTSFTVGTAGSFDYLASGYPNAPTIALGSGSLPAGLSLTTPVHFIGDHGDRVTSVEISGTPLPGTGGTYNITLVASNGLSPNSTLPATITVYEAPAITSANHATFTALRSNSFHVAATGGYPGSVSFSESGALPPGVTLSASGSLTGNPPVSASGYWPVTITASNGHVSVSQSFTLFVHAPTVPAGSMSDPGGLTAQSLSADHECVSWTLSGFAPYAPVTVIGYPQSGGAVPFALGTYNTNASGRVGTNVCLPGSARGTYTLLAAGYATSGTVRYQEARTIVQP